MSLLPHRHASEHHDSEEQPPRHEPEHEPAPPPSHELPPAPPPPPPAAEAKPVGNQMACAPEPVGTGGPTNVQPPREEPGKREYGDHHG